MEKQNREKNTKSSHQDRGGHKFTQNGAEGNRPALPMPYTGARRLEAEWREYHDRQARHREQFPDYDAGFGQPAVLTAQKVWKLLARRLGIKVSDLLPDHPWITPDETDVLAVRAMRALVVAIDAAVLAGERGRMLTTNMVFDALAAHWSDNYRACVESGHAAISYDMTRGTLRDSWRDLLRNGIRIDALLKIVQGGCQDLYSTKRIPKRGYTVDVPSSRMLKRYTELVEEGYRRRSEHPRLLLVDEQSPRSYSSCDIAAEWKYNVAEAGPRSLECIHRLEDARLYFHVPSFMDDVRRLEEVSADIRKRLDRKYGVDVTATNAKPRGRRRTKSGALRRSPRQWAMRHVPWRDVSAVKSLVESYDKVTGHVNQLKDVRTRLREIEAAGGIDAEGFVVIKSRFYKLMNRRYQAANFWPMEVSGKDVIEHRLHEDKPGINVISSRRGRWFRAESKFDKPGWGWEGAEEWNDEWAGDRRPLAGVDVSGSQLQLLAAFIGDESLEEALAERAYKEIAAKLAWARHEDLADPFKLPEGFEGSEDDKLRAAVKQATMTHLYGSDLREVAFKLQESRDDYGPGLGDKDNINRLLSDERLHLRGILEWFLPACQSVADVAWTRDPYAGIVFTDPFDGATVRWNPVRRRTKRAAGTGPVVVYASLPFMVKTSVRKGKSMRQWVPAIPNSVGDYPVDLEKVRRDVAPCLTQMLDAMFAGLVVEKLNGLGVRDVVSVHDSWLIASDAAPALNEAVEAVGEPWLRALGPVYDALVQYLDTHKVYDPWARGIRQKWEHRVANGKKWPLFRVGVPILMEMRSRSIDTFIPTPKGG